MAICSCGAYVEFDGGHETLPYCDNCSRVVEFSPSEGVPDDDNFCSGNWDDYGFCDDGCGRDYRD